MKTTKIRSRRLKKGRVMVHSFDSFFDRHQFIKRIMKSKHITGRRRIY